MSPPQLRWQRSAETVAPLAIKAGSFGQICIRVSLDEVFPVGTAPFVDGDGMADACDVRQRARVGPSQVAEPQEAGCLYGVPQTQVRHRYSVVPHLVRAVLTDGGEQRLVLGAPAERAGELGPLVVLVWGEIPVDRVLFD